MDLETAPADSRITAARMVLESAEISYS